MSGNSKGSGMYGQRRRNQFRSPTGIGSIGGSDAGCGDWAAQNKSPDFAEQAKSAANKVSDTLSKTVGIEKLEGFSLKALFADVFKKHPEEEVERIFMYGTPETTPDIRDVDTSWPQPWIFTRALIASVAIYWVLHTGFGRTGNIFLLPSMMFIGSFAVPMSALIFFIESNVRRNVSLEAVGGVALPESWWVCIVAISDQLASPLLYGYGRDAVAAQEFRLNARLLA